MKFQVRDGFICRLVNSVELGNGKTETQENTVFGGQTVELSADQAELHAHKLEPLDKSAAAWLAAKVLPAAPGAELGLTPEALALVKALASEMAKQIVDAVQTPAPAAA